MNARLTRRGFLAASATAAGGLLLALKWRGAVGQPGGTQRSPWLFVSIEPDGFVTIGARGTEIGQGVKTSLPMLIAEELDVPWSMVRVKQLPYEVSADDERRSKFGAQGAGGSTSIPDGWDDLRRVGATGRRMLVEAAAERWDVDADLLSTDQGQVVHPDGQRVSYADVASAAAQRSLPDKGVALKDPSEFRIIGQPTPTVDSREIVTGTAPYGLDARVEGALVAVIERCPYFGGEIDSVDDSAARKVPGVRAVIHVEGPGDEGDLGLNLAAGVAVVAEDTWSALKGRRALKVTWRQGRWKDDSTDALRARAEAALEEKAEVARRDGNPAAARERAAKVITHRYEMPFLSHSPLEPQNATVEIGPDRARVIASMQSPGGAMRLVSSLTGLPRSQIEIQLPRSGGGFGRRLENDFVAEAVLIAQQVKAPIRLIWTREDDLQHDWYRPYGLHELTATLDENNQVTSWVHRVAATDRRFRKDAYQQMPPWVACLDPDALPAGCVDHYAAEFVPVEFGLARGWWRAPLPTFTAFPTQRFMHDVAVEAGVDPLAFQLDLIGEPRKLDYDGHGGPVVDTGRIAAVLKRAAREIGYGRELPDGRGIGVAAHFTFGGYAAHAMEVSVEQGQPVIHRCVCAVDVGRVVNPLGVEAQMQGATTDGISTALQLAITVTNGRIDQNNFPNYRLLPMAQAPDVEVYIVDSDEPPAGAGEMGIPSAAPALANAIAAASGQSVRRLPIANQLRA